MTDTNAKSTSAINPWRVAGWSAAGGLLLLPAIAMQFTPEVVWTPGDFIFAALLLFALGVGLELAIRFGRDAPHRVGMAISVWTAFLTIWANGAVGMIGNENAPVNSGFNVIVLAGILASLLVWFRPQIMRWIALAAAVGQMALGVAATQMMPGHGVEWGVLTVFAAAWLAATACFHRAAIARRARSDEARVPAG